VFICFVFGGFLVFQESQDRSARGGRGSTLVVASIPTEKNSGKILLRGSLNELEGGEPELGKAKKRGGK